MPAASATVDTMSTGPTTPATLAPEAAGLPFRAHPYHHDPDTESFGLEAAAVLGVEPERVFKTLMADVDGELVVGIVPVTARLQLKALAAAVGAKRAHVIDLREEFARDYILPALQAGALYEGKYPLATALGRPLIDAFGLDVRPLPVEFPAAPVDPFFNANRPEDLAEAERLVAEER